AVAEEYVPVGARKLRVKDAAGLHVGDRVLVEHPSTAKWVSTLGMDQTPGRDVGRLTWLPGKMDVRWDRTVTAIDGDAITLHAPLTPPLRAPLGGGRVFAYAWPGRVTQVGVESLRCASAFDRANSHDEEHAWMAVTLDAAENSWVRQVTAVNFVSSAVAVGDGCKGVTVEDC